VVVISGEAGSKTKEFCKGLGVAAYFEKPVDFDALTKRLEEIMTVGRKERRSEIRVRLRVPLRLRGSASDGKAFEAHTITENVSLSGFLCSCDVSLANGTVVEVFMAGSPEPVGTACIVRSEGADTKYPRYGCRFTKKTGSWVLQ
jgi:hypothetical protein